MSNIQVPSTTQQKVTVFWDIENCPVPSGFEGYEVVVALRNLALRYGFLHRIVAIVNLDQLSKSQRNALQDSGVSMHDVSSSKPSAADMAIFIEILKLVMDIPPPHVIIMITGDRDFSKLFHVLVGRGYHVVLLHTAEACPVLQSTATEHLLWQDFLNMTCTYRNPTQQESILSVQNNNNNSPKSDSSPINDTQSSQNGLNRHSKVIQPASSNTQANWNSKSPVSLSRSQSAPTFGPLVDYLTLETQQGRHVVKLCDLGVQKDIPWRKYYMKLKNYIEAAARLGFVTMIYLPNNQIGVCLTDKCHFTLIRKIQKLIQDLPYILEQMKLQFLAPVEQNLQNVVKSRYGFRANPHHWEIFLQCLQCCGYQVTGPVGKRSIIGILGSFDGFDPSEPKHTLQGDALKEFEEFLTSSNTDNEGGFTWNTNSGRFGFVTDLLQVGPPLIKATPSGVLLSHIQIMLNNRALGYNKDNKICRAEYVDQPANISIDINVFHQKLENALAPHSTLLHPLIELQVAAPLVRDLWKCLGFSKMKHCLKYAEENGILLCDWKVRENNNTQPWIALSSSIKPLISAVEMYFEQTEVDHVDASVIKTMLERKYGYIRTNPWKDIMTVSSKHPLLNIKQNGTNYVFFRKKEQLENPSEEIPSSKTAYEQSSALDANTEEEGNQLGPNEYNHYHAPGIITHLEPDSFHQYQFQIHEPKSECLNYRSPGFPGELQNNVVGSGLQSRLHTKYLPEASNNESMFHTSPFAVMGQTEHKEEVDFEEDHDDIIYHLNKLMDRY